MPGAINHTLPGGNDPTPARMPYARPSMAKGQNWNHRKAVRQFLVSTYIDRLCYGWSSTYSDLKLMPPTSNFLPIKFMAKDGSISDSPPGAPVVRAKLHFLEDDWTGPRTIPGELVYALIDTGADHIYATPEYLAATGCPSGGTIEVQGATSTIESSRHPAYVFLPDLALLVKAEVFATPLAGNGRRYSLVLGMSFLQQGRLVLDPTTAEYHFIYRPG